MTVGTALFLPCRAGSERVRDKNTRPFADHPQGLLGIKLDQLERTRGFDAIVVDSNDPRVLEIAARRATTWSGPATLEVRERPDELGRSTTTTDSLIRYALTTIDCEHLAWTHVTSPLMTPELYAAALAAFRTRDPAVHDSLLTVTPIRSFVWQDDDGRSPRPVNYATQPLRWPRTQDLRPLFEVNSALFVVPRAIGQERGDRIGRCPRLHALDPLHALDIDWEDDFHLAEAVYRWRFGSTWQDRGSEVAG